MATTPEARAQKKEARREARAQQKEAWQKLGEARQRELEAEQREWEEREAERLEQALRDQHGTPNPAMICPHCQTKGSVGTRQTTKKSGISGAKATGAVLTGGLSVLATGLSQKEQFTQAHCDNCGASWRF